MLLTDRQTIQLVLDDGDGFMHTCYYGRLANVLAFRLMFGAWIGGIDFVRKLQKNVSGHAGCCIIYPHHGCMIVDVLESNTRPR